MFSCLITGGTGYIGSHAATFLIEKGYDVTIVDNLVNSKANVIDLINEICLKKPTFYKGDIRDTNFLETIFIKHNFDIVMHFAGLKSIEGSLINKNEYYDVNINGTENLLSLCNKYKVNKFIFSSSATVYGNNHNLPWSEELYLNLPTNPYAKSKYLVEKKLVEISKSNLNFRAGILRYFNPIGAHSSGKIGENISPQSTNLVPNMINVYLGKKKYLDIFGNDFNTHDGTGVRDYIHIHDLIVGHFKVIDFLNKNSGCHIWNLGNGIGYSVLDVINEFEHTIKRSIPKKFVARRKSDLDKYWADPRKAHKELEWIAEKNLGDMVSDLIRFVKKQKYI